MSLAADAPLLQPRWRPLARMAEQLPDMPVTAYFDGLFADYETENSGSDAWDLPALIGAVRRWAPYGRVLDVGCGDGRVTRAIAEAELGHTIVGIDVAAQPIDRLRRWASTRSGGPSVETVHADIRDAAELVEPVDLAVVGSVTVNCFVERDELDSFLRAVRAVLRPAGAVAVVVFDVSVRERFRTLDGRVSARPFKGGDGRQYVMWRSIAYDANEAVLRQEYLVQAGWHADGTVHLRCAIHRERVWTPADVVAVAAAAGLDLVGSVSCHVEGGGADGWPTVCLQLQRPEES